ncbi:MAG: hypothetical protein ACHP7H_00630 [Hyphomicrobiales bacterium]
MNGSSSSPPAAPPHVLVARCKVCGVSVEVTPEPGKQSTVTLKHDEGCDYAIAHKDSPEAEAAWVKEHGHAIDVSPKGASSAPPATTQ